MIKSLYRAALLAAFGLVGLLNAQQQVPSYRPAKPTITPYLYLTRPETGGELPNYQTFVEPYRNQQATNFDQRTEVRGLQRQVKKTTDALYAPAATAPTGVNSQYNNHSHYYQGRQSGSNQGSKRGARR